MTTCPRMTRFADLVDRYDDFVVDQWGVLHDGQAAYPGVEACLKRLIAHGEWVILLGNSPRFPT